MPYRALQRGLVRFKKPDGKERSREVQPGDVFDLLPGQHPGKWMEEVKEAPVEKKPAATKKPEAGPT